MTGRSHSTENNKKQPASTPAQGMFQPRPFVVQPQTEEPEQPDIKTALQRAERYGHRLDRIKSIKPPVQAKLTIGQAGDHYEQEADRVAAQVVNSFHAPTTQRQEMPEEDELQMKPEIGSIQRQELPEEDEELQMKPEAGTTQRQELPEEDEELQMQPAVQLQPNGSEMTAQPDLEASLQQARGSGHPLADSIKEPMEQAFGADFSRVKIHTDAQSDQLNRSIQARAFTTGQDVFFRSGEYNPGSRGGQELIAHELTHVVQQNGGAVYRQAKQQTEQIGIQASQDAIQCDPWDQQQSDKEQNLADQQNARIEQGAAAPGNSPVSIGAQQQQNNTTSDQERHIDDDMLKTLEIVLNSLPPSHINGNPALSRIVLEHDQGNGASFFADNKLTIVIPFDAASWVYLNVTKWPLGDLATTLLGSKHPTKFLTRDIVGTGSNIDKLKMVPENFVEWMLRHETGHSVDKAIGWHDGKHYREPNCGAWEIHENETSMEGTILSAIGITGAILTNLNNAFGQYTQSGYTSITNALNSSNKNELNPSYRKAALQAFERTNPGGSRLVDYAEKVIRVGLSSPYENGGGVNLNNRTYQRDPQQGEWVSYQSDKYALRNSNYQYQSPGEWFAETYSHYFIPPADKWGEKVKDPAARQWFRTNLNPVNGNGSLIQAGNLVQLPESLLAAPQQNAAPPPTRTAEALDLLKNVSISIGTVPLSLVTRTLGTTVGTLQLTKIPLQYVYRQVKGLF